MPNFVNRTLKKDYEKFFDDISSVIAIGYPGMDVQETNELRAALKKAGFKMKFLRNRVAAKSFESKGFGNAETILNRQTAFCVGADIVAVARFLVDFQKKHEKVLLHGALVDGVSIIGEESVKRLSKTPTKEELKSIISGQTISLGSRLSGALLAMGGKVASQIKQKAEPKDESASA